MRKIVVRCKQGIRRDDVETMLSQRCRPDEFVPEVKQSDRRFDGDANKRPVERRHRGGVETMLSQRCHPDELVPGEKQSDVDGDRRSVKR